MGKVIRVVGWVNWLSFLIKKLGSGIISDDYGTGFLFQNFIFINAKSNYFGGRCFF